jgi:2-methylisocitrate lyase-like PEP mutase family enzyme
MNFKNLHQQTSPLLLCNVWNVASAKIAEKLNFSAIGTSSSAIATMLGYNDGEEIPFAELAYIVQRIASSTKLPLSVDLESGYSQEPQQIADHIRQLKNWGIVGINIEDSVVSDQRTLLEAEQFLKTLSQVKATLRKNKVDIFINVRIDTFVVPSHDVIKETVRRIQMYQNAGADGIFVPCVVEEKDIARLVNSTHLPLNVMCMPGLPGFGRLSELGVKRISMGNFLFDKMCECFETVAARITNEQSFKSIFYHAGN